MLLFSHHHTHSHVATPHLNSAGASAVGGRSGGVYSVLWGSWWLGGGAMECTSTPPQY